MIKVPCPKCGARYSVKDEYAGKTIKCKKCAAGIPVPQTTKTPESSSAPDSPFAFDPIPDPAAVGSPPTPPASGKPRRGLLIGGIVGGGLTVCLFLLCCGGIGTYWFFPGFLSPLLRSSIVGTWEQEGSRRRQREVGEVKGRADRKLLTPSLLLAQELPPVADDERDIVETENATLFEFSRWGSGKVINDKTIRKNEKVTSKQKETLIEFDYTYSSGNPGILEIKYKKANKLVKIEQETVRIEVRFDADRKGMSWKGPPGEGEHKMRRLD